MWSLCKPVETSLAIKTKTNYHDSLSDFHSSVCTDDYQKLLANDKTNRLKKKINPSPPNHQYSPPKKPRTSETNVLLCPFTNLCTANVRLLICSRMNDFLLWPFSGMYFDSQRKRRKLYLQCKLFYKLVTSSLIFQLRHR